MTNMTGPSEQRPSNRPDIKQATVTYYEVPELPNFRFETLEIASQAREFADNALEINAILGRGPRREFKCHNPEAVKRFSDAVKLLLPVFDRPNSCITNVVNHKELLGAATLLRLDNPGDVRAMLAAELLLRLARIDTEGKEWRDGPGAVPHELRRYK